MLAFQQRTNQNSFWIKEDVPLELFNELKCDTYLKGDFRKVGKTFSIPTYRSYYLLKNYLLYGKLNKMETLSSCKGYAFLTPVYVEFGMDEKYYIIKLISVSEQVTLSTNNGLQFLEWQEALSNICIMTSFLQDFQIEEQIGDGNFSTVHQCQSQTSLKKYAVKIVERNIFKQTPRMRESIVNEIIALRQLSHQNVLKVYRIYDSPQFIYIVTELLSGGTLISKTGRFRKLNIQELKIIMKNLLEALNHIHINKIIHRDIKPNNILFKNKENPLEVVIIDFGLAALTKYKRYGYPKCGSPCYSAPEVLNYVEGKKLYTSKCDVYSLGITFFILFYGYNPFLADELNKSMKNNGEGYIDFPKTTLVPAQVRRLLDQMLRKHPKERYTAGDALEDSFFHEKIDNFFDFKIYKAVLSKKQYEKKQVKEQARIKKASFSIPCSVKDNNSRSNHITTKSISNRSFSYLNELKYGGTKNKNKNIDFGQQRQEDHKKTQNTYKISNQNPQDRPKSKTTSKAYHPQFMEAFSSNSELFSQNVPYEQERQTIVNNRQTDQPRQIQELGQELEQDEQQYQKKHKQYVKDSEYQQYLHDQQDKQQTIQNQEESQQQKQDAPQDHLGIKEEKLREDQQIVYTSDHLSTIQSQDFNYERPKKFSFSASITPFQRYKSVRNTLLFSKVIEDPPLN